jgi:hypothetical protein
MARESESYREQPTYWFAVLESALERGDLERAADAQRELNRLGVRVSYERLAPKGPTR